MDASCQLGLIKQRIAAGGGLRLTVVFDNAGRSAADLSAELTERERAEGRLKTAAAAYRSWLLGRLAAKDALGWLWNCPPGEAEVLKGPEGAPQAGPVRPGPAAWVSISHTVGAAAAVVAEFPVGVDLERLDRPVSPRVWRWAFSPAELEFLREPPEGPAQAESEKIPPGLALWCAKEAAAKAWGKALLNHLEQVRVTGTDWPEGRITVGYYEDCSRIRQSEVRLTAHNGYLAALARVIE